MLLLGNPRGLIPGKYLEHPLIGAAQVAQFGFCIVGKLAGGLTGGRRFEGQSGRR
jgi:hypothetical protein